MNYRLKVNKCVAKKKFSICSRLISMIHLRHFLKYPNFLMQYQNLSVFQGSILTFDSKVADNMSNISEIVVNGEKWMPRFRVTYACIRQKSVFFSFFSSGFRLSLILLTMYFSVFPLCVFIQVTSYGLGK